jgi:MinD-like ATPase involved in chromosome partitioning or flagellar assembly
VTAGDLPVLLGVTGEPYEPALLAALARPGSRLRVVRRCLDLTDLLAAAAAGQARAAVLSAGLHGLDREAVARLAAAGVVAVGVVVAEADVAADTAERLRGLGARVVPASNGADGYDGRALAASVLEAASDDVMPGVEHGFAVAGDPRGGPGGAVAASGFPVGLGRLVAVWGPVGAPGRTTVALGLADILARSGAEVVLADADTYGACVAQRLGVLDEASGLAAAVRAAAAGRLDAVTLASSARSVAPRLRVLIGIAGPQRWPELRPAALGVVWQVARQLADVTVVDVGCCLEDDEELSYDTVAPRRNAAAVLTLAAADDVVAVGAADPVGIPRLVRGLHDLRERGLAREPCVVVNRVRPGVLGRNPGREVRQALDRLADVDSVVLVPDDPTACDASLASARLLTDVAPTSPAAVALRALADDLRLVSPG